jgi:uncharacterized protein YkwD
MFRALIAVLAILWPGGDAPPANPPSAKTTVKTRPQVVPANMILSATPAYDAGAEHALLQLANEAREQAGLAPLQSDDGLTEAAREHAAAMAAERQLSHQFSGEPALAERIAANSDLHLDRAGENVAYAETVDRAEDGLMHSPPHRENLLNAGFNVAGFAVVHSGALLYVVQDFGHNLARYSAEEAVGRVADRVSRSRREAGLPALHQDNSPAVQAAACALADHNSLNVPTPQALGRSHAILRYTSNDPGKLPTAASKAIGDLSLNSFSAGSCYARTASYPNGVYWVILSFY